MRVKIILHGHLRKVWPHGFECEAATPAQAMNAYVTMNNLAPFSAREKWIVEVLDHPTVAALHSPLRFPELHIVPAFSGGGGFVKIAIGVVLIVAAIVTQQYYSLPFVASALFAMGTSLALSGVMELLSPTPKLTPINNNDTASKYLGSPPNTTAIGTPIAIGYGRYLWSGQFLSFNLESDPAPVNGQPPLTSTFSDV